MKNDSEFNYEDLFFGLYFDIDAVIGDINGYSGAMHTPSKACKRSR